MTTEPKFVPKEAAEIQLSEDVSVRVRLIDCVGYMVEGASGHKGWQELYLFKKGNSGDQKDGWGDENLIFIAREQ